MDQDGRAEEINAYVASKINNLFGNIQFSLLDDKITYDAQGVLTQKPVIMAEFNDGFGNKRPVSNLPLKVDIISGSGNILGESKTSTYGQAEINLKVDAVNPVTTIMASIDKNRVYGLEKFNTSILPSSRKL